MAGCMIVAAVGMEAIVAVVAPVVVAGVAAAVVEPFRTVVWVPCT